MLRSLTRRAALALAALAPAAAARAQARIALTPAQTAGPFYPQPDQRPGDTDWDLVRVAGAVREAGGEILHLDGTVRDRSGQGVAGVLVEIWQCDAGGRYLHPRDRGGAPRDPGFQGFGAVITGTEGGYRFRTIRPVPYPGRTPHIHARLVTPDGRELVTQLYVSDDPGNRGDWIFRALGAAGQDAATFRPARRADGDLEAGFDFVV